MKEQTIERYIHTGTTEWEATSLSCMISWHHCTVTKADNKWKLKVNVADVGSALSQYVERTYGTAQEAMTAAEAICALEG